MALYKPRRAVQSIAGALLLAGVSTLAQGDGDKAGQAQDWPKRGDTIYVSATLVNFKVSPHILGTQTGPRESKVPPCIPMTIKKAKPDKELWTTDHPPLHAGERLQGPWLPYMHKTEAECKSSLERNGEPRIVRDGWIHQIVPEEQED